MAWKWQDIASIISAFLTGPIGPAIFQTAKGVEGIKNATGSDAVGPSQLGALDKLVENIAGEREYNSAEAQKNRDFQERMSNTAVQRAVSDIKAAGLNPWLAVNGAPAISAAVPSGDSASSSSNSALSSLLGSIMSQNTKLATAAISAISNTVNSAMKMVAEGASGK